MPIERGLVRARLGHIHYRALGAGPAVVLFHINQQSSALMRELMEALAPDFRAVAIDYPSHGHSDPIDFQPSFADYAECAVAVMDALGIQRAHAMGEAVGAGVSIALANASTDSACSAAQANASSRWAGRRRARTLPSMTGRYEGRSALRATLRRVRELGTNAEASGASAGSGPCGIPFDPTNFAALPSSGRRSRCKVPDGGGLLVRSGRWSNARRIRALRRTARVDAHRGAAGGTR